jgi:hypothetical protein
MIRTVLFVWLTIAFLSGYGQKIFQADSGKEAQVKVFAVEEPNEADLWVCFVWNESELTKTGLWMDMRFAHEADVIIFFVDEEKESDLKIWLVDTPQESKWLTPDKRKLLALKKNTK